LAAAAATVIARKFRGRDDDDDEAFEPVVGGAEDNGEIGVAVAVMSESGADVGPNTGLLPLPVPVGVGAKLPAGDDDFGECLGEVLPLLLAFFGEFDSFGGGTGLGGLAANFLNSITLCQNKRFSAPFDQTK
jgi:hypothetical protein